MRTRHTFAGASVAIYEVWCDDEPEPSTPVEESEASQIVLPHRGVFIRDVDGREVVASPAVAVFFNAGDTGRIVHPVSHGDASTVLIPAESTLESLVPGSGMLPLTARALSVGSMVDHAGLRHLLRGGAAVADPLAVEELAATAMVGIVGVPTRSTSAGSSRRQARIAARVESRLAVEFCSRVSLSDLAADSGTSVFEVSRAVSRVTGRSVTELRDVFRFRHALEHLNDDGMSLSRLAIESGYSDQPHMTRAFHRLLGMPPAQARRHLTTMTRKNVQDAPDRRGSSSGDGCRTGPTTPPRRRPLPAADT